MTPPIRRSYTNDETGGWSLVPKFILAHWNLWVSLLLFFSEDIFHSFLSKVKCWGNWFITLFLLIKSYMSQRIWGYFKSPWPYANFSSPLMLHSAYPFPDASVFQCPHQHQSVICFVSEETQIIMMSRQSITWNQTLQKGRMEQPRMIVCSSGDLYYF